jgi:uncharacterized protein YkwD
MLALGCNLMDVQKGGNSMKKFFVAALITVTTLTSTFYGGNLNVTSTNPAAVVSAATSSIKTRQPSLSLSARTATTATLNIGRVTGAQGYKIYRSSQMNGTYEYVGATKSTIFKDTGLNYAKSYYYKVRAYVVENGSKVHSTYSNKLSVYETLGKVTSLKGTPNSSSSINLSWKSVNGASKYKVYRSSSLNGTYNYVGITGNNYYIDKNLSNGNTYYYIVRAYKNIDGGKYNGVFSNKLSVALQFNSYKPIVTPTPTPSNPDNNDTSTTDKGFANEVLTLVNKERAQEGLSALSMSDTLLPPANTRAKEIKQVFSHTRPDGRSWSTVLSDYNISVQTAGENLAYGYNTPEAVVTGWMNSPGHRANILNGKFKNIGIGVYTDSKGTVYCTQIFSN